MSGRPKAAAAAETERSIAALRGVLALIGAALALGSRSADGGTAFSLQPIALAVAIVGAAGLLWWLPHGLRRLGLGPTPSATVMQLLDIAAALGLTYVVSDVLPDAAWALLTIPIVVASLRLNAVGVLWVWLVTSLGYTGLLWIDVVDPGRAAIGQSLVLERPGALLAIAAGVALLTRWLQAGWVEQAQLTDEAQLRFQHVQAIERAGREMRGRTPDEVVTTCLHHVVELGFDAATVTGGDRPIRAVGDGSIVPADETIDPPAAGTVGLTEWHGPEGCVYSAAMVEPRSNMVISGWSLRPPGTLQADALSELVAHTTSGVELAELLGQARFEADHDALTGLANRAQFERRLRASAREQTALAMLFMDLDHFKQINDRYGHEAGDWALQQVGAMLHEHIGEVGLAARYGGDEFVAIIAGHAVADVQALATRLLAAVEEIAERSALGHQRIELGISVGIALAAGPVDPDVLRRAADRAVFTAKGDGRGRTATTWVSPSSECVGRAEPVAAAEPVTAAAPPVARAQPAPVTAAPPVARAQPGPVTAAAGPVARAQPEPVTAAAGPVARALPGPAALPPPVLLSALPVPARAAEPEPAAQLVGSTR